MSNPILLVQDAGIGETPVPKNALVAVGEEMGIHDGEGGERKAVVVAVVPALGNVDYAIADQNKKPRPLCIRPDVYDETTYVLDVEGEELLVGHAALERARGKADEAGLNN